MLNKDQRKTKAEGIILSRLFYCLETTSTGLISNMERLQGVQSAAARWVLQVRRRDWSLRGGVEEAWMVKHMSASSIPVSKASNQDIAEEKTRKTLQKPDQHTERPESEESVDRGEPYEAELIYAEGMVNKGTQVVEHDARQHA